MERIFLPIYRFFKKKKWLLYTILTLSSVFFLIFGLQVRYEEDITKLLPQSGKTVESGLAFGDLKVKDKIFIQFHPVREDLDPETLSSCCDLFFEELEEKDRETGYIDNILYRIDNSVLAAGLEYALDHIPEFMDEACYAGLDSLTRTEAVQEAVKEAAAQLEEGKGRSRKAIGAAMDPLGLRNTLAGKAAEMKDGLSDFAIIRNHFFTPDSTTCLAFLSPGFQSLDSKDDAKLVRLLEKEIGDFNKEHEDIEVLFHGAPVQGAFNSRKIKSDLFLTIGISLVLICLLIGLCLRGKSTLPIMLFPVAYGTLFSLTCIWFIKGSMSLMAMGIGAIVLGVALSYSLHIVVHYKYVTDPEQVIREQATPVCLGSITTIGAFAGLLLTRSELLRDFGIFASLAMVGTTLAALIFVPHFFIPERNRKSEKAFAVMDKINAYPYDRNRWLVGAIAVISVVCLFTSRKVVFDSDLKHIGYQEPDVVRSRELFAEKNCNGLSSMYFAASGNDLEEALCANETMYELFDSLQRDGSIRSFSKASSLFSTRSDQEEAIRRWEEWWSPEKKARLRKDMDAAAREAGLDPARFTPFWKMVGKDFQPESLYEAGILPEDLLCNFVEESGGKSLVFTNVKMEKSMQQQVCDQVAKLPGAVVIDPFFYTNDMVMMLHKDFNTILAISTIFVFVVLLFSFRNFWLALIAFLPMSMSWIIVEGIMQMAGIEFNLINIIISTFIFGIGVDYSIFVMDGLRAGTSGDNRTLLAYHKTAILFSATIMILVIGSLLFATHPAIRSIGVTTLIGMVSTILITYTIEPLFYRLYVRVSSRHAHHG